VTDDGYFKIENNRQPSPINLKIDHMFGHPPKTIIIDRTIDKKFKELDYEVDQLHQYLNQVLQLEAVACKDWLTNKVDRSVTGKVAKQQTAGSLQLPLNDVSAMALDYQGVKGMATSIGHASVAGLIDAKAGSRLSLAEALTNLIWAPLTSGLKGVSLSANWMWPSKNSGEDARLYDAVEALSDFACELGINIPTGKDSLSMKQKYPDGKEVISPGTVIISAAAEVSDIRKIVEPVIIADADSHLIYLDLSQTDHQLGGSSFSQILSQLGSQTPDIKDPKYFIRVFGVLQQLIDEGKILAGHDISAGGMITTLLEMVFLRLNWGMEVNLDQIPEQDIIKLLFSENPGLILQIKDLQHVENIFNLYQLTYYSIGKPVSTKQLAVHHQNNAYHFDIDELRDTWYITSFLLDAQQTAEGFAQKRFNNYKKQELSYQFSSGFTGQFAQFGIDPYRRENSGIRAAIIREKGVNGDREMAYALYLAGFDVKDIHMTDLVSGSENLEDVNFVVYVGGFSNSDVLGSAKGWAGAFLFNSKAKKALDNFYQRSDTLSLGVCNGCQLMAELGLIYPHHEVHPQLLPNQSSKFESAFINVDIQQNHSVMLHSLAGSRLGIWVAHGEGRFKFPYQPEKYNIAAKYCYSDYPGNPNSSDWDVACIYSEDGRHLALMPHLERSFYPWQWPYYSKNRKNDQITPWIEAFVNAREWVKNKNQLPIAEKANH